MKKYISLLVVTLLALQQLTAQPALQYKNYTEHYYKGLRYGLFMPAGYKPSTSYPLVVYLHGRNDTVSRDNLLYHDSIQAKHPCFVITPKCPEPNQGGWGNTWFKKHTEATAQTLALVDSLVKRYAVDSSRLYIYGISMGGVGVFSVLAKEKGKFAAGIAICGGSRTGAAAQLLQTPLWMFHGEADDIVPIALSRDLYHEIIRLGGKKARYTEYPGVKHNSWENALREPELIPWLFAQKKE